MTGFDRKTYMKEYMQKYLQTEDGFLTKQYARFNERELCAISKQAFITWSKKQSSFHNLFTHWKQNTNDTWLKPSVDRIDPYKPYELGNLQWLTWRDNHIKMRTEKKNVLSYTKTFSEYRQSRQYYVIVTKNDFFMMFKNMNEIVSCFRFMQKAKICDCVNSKRKTHWGFSFRKYGGDALP